MPGGIARASEIVREILKGVSRGGCKNRDGESLIGFFEEFMAGFFFLIVIFLNRMREIWRKYF